MRLFDKIKKRFSNLEKEFKYKKQLLIIDKIVYVFIVLLLSVFRPDLLAIAVYFLLYPYLFLTARKGAYYHLLISSLIAVIWMLIAKDEYGYNINMISVFGINLFPLFAWAVGLFIAYMLYSHCEHVLKKHTLLRNMLLFVAIYWPLLILFETIAYHLFNIKNLAAAAYVGLPICDCIHAPRWMQISYFALGPIYFGICELLGLENPHHIKK